MFLSDGSGIIFKSLFHKLPGFETTEIRAARSDVLLDMWTAYEAFWEKRSSNLFTPKKLDTLPAREMIDISYRSRCTGFSRRRWRDISFLSRRMAMSGWLRPSQWKPMRWCWLTLFCYLWGFVFVASDFLILIFKSTIYLYWYLSPSISSFEFDIAVAS